MIDLDSYINEYYAKNLATIMKPIHCSNLNFSRLTPEKKLVQLIIDVQVKEYMVIREKLDWDLNDDKKSPEVFAGKFISDLRDIIQDEELIEYNKQSLKNQILDQLLEHVQKNTMFPKLRITKKDSDGLTVNQLCLNCNTLIYNPEYCVNCMIVFEKRFDKKPANAASSNSKENHEGDKIEDSRQTDRQRIIELRQKSINIEEIGSYSEEKEKKVCKKCGEVNAIVANECRNCKHKFPLISYYENNINHSYSVHFWDKINKNQIVQQLKNFSTYFGQEDFSSLKFLYERVKVIIDQYFKEILTDDAYFELHRILDKTYFSFSNPTATTDKVFDSAYLSKFSKYRPKYKMLNFNHLTDIKEGWLPDNLPEKNIEEKKEDKVKTSENLIKRKRGRPKKMEIFKNDMLKLNEIQITLTDRDALLKADVLQEEELLHYDFCGKCQDAGKLICCETCSSAYHYECLGYDKFPRGKFKCYFCKIVKIGIDQAVTVDKTQMKLIQKLLTFNKKVKWESKAQDFLDILKEHHCASFFKQPVPTDFKEYYHEIKEPRDLTLIEIKLNHKDYLSLKDFIKDLSLVWSNTKKFYKPNSFFYKQADTLEALMTHLIKEEGVFDSFDFEKEKKVSRDDPDECDIAIIIEQ